MTCPVCSCPDTTRRFQVSRPEPDMYAALAAQQGMDGLAPAEYCECGQCGAFYWLEDGRFERIYHGFAYAAETGDAESFIRERFEKIVTLPPDRSDNVQRVARIRQFLATHAPAATGAERTVLDIGAGMGVFLHGFLAAPWRGAAIEPDPAACEHMRRVLPGTVVVQAYVDQAPRTQSYDLITLNRTLEHVPNPVAFLHNAAQFMAPGGIAYVELPDVWAYFHNGPNDQDFGYGHYVVYSPLALATVGAGAGLDLISMDRVREPSGKFTIFGFFTQRNEPTPDQDARHER